MLMQRATGPLKRATRSSFSYLKKMIHSSETLRSLVYDDANRQQFSDLDKHEIMLADLARVNSYHEAIRRAVKPGDVVIDLGTGSGILAMFAAKQGAKMVYAIEHGDIIEVAKAVAAANGISNISFIRKNSRDFVAPELADIIIHEQIGSYLFEENMIENLLDLKSRALKPGGRILPARFQLFIEPVSLLADHRVPYCWEAPVDGIDFSVLKNDEIDRKYRLNPRWRPIQAGSVSHYACNPEPLLEFDLNSPMDETSIPTKLRAQKAVVRDSRIDGLAVFFKAMFDDDELGFSNAPDKQHTNWWNHLYRIPARNLKMGDQVIVSLNIGKLRDPSTWDVGLR